MKNSLLLLVLICSLGLLIACGGGASGGHVGGGGNQIVVGLNPSSPQSIDMNQADPISASVTGDSRGEGVKWTVTCAVGVNSCGGMAQASTASGAQNMFNAPIDVATAETVILTATSVADSSKFATVAVTLNPTPTLANPPPAQPQPGTVGQPFSFSLAPFVQGGSAPFNWTIKSGALPAGLSLAAASGMISGTPTAATATTAQRQAQLRASATSGAATNLVFTGTDSGKPSVAVDVPISLTVNASPGGGLKITSLAPPNGTVGTSYGGMQVDQGNQFTGFPLTATGGTGTYTWTWSAAQGSSLPAGLNISILSLGGSTRCCITVVVINGTPTAAGAYTVIVTVADSASPANHASANYPIAISNQQPLAITTPSPLVGGTAGVGYFASVMASGGVPPYTFSLATGSGPLPTNLTLNTAINRASGGTWGVISGTPTAAGTFSNINIQVSDSLIPPSTATMTYSITIAPPLQLSFVTTSPLLSAGVGIFYNGFIETTGGIGPYTFKLGSGSAPLPDGLSLPPSASGLISGTPTTAGTTNNIVVDVADSQTPTATATMTYSLTVDPSNFYVGTQAPGDVWQLGISDTSATDGVFGFQNQGSNGLTGPLSGTGSQPTARASNGFLVLFNFGGIAVEMPGDMALLTPGNQYESQISSSNGRVIAAVANSCPHLTAMTNFQFVALADEDFDLTKDAYGVAAVTESAANTYNFAFDSFTLDGGTGTSNTLSGLSCDSNLKVFSSTSATGITTTIAISASGLMVIDNGTGIPTVGLQRPTANLSTAAILGGQYLGTVFYANDRVTNCSPTTPSTTPTPQYCRPIPQKATDFVGFGPGSATSISGGTYQNFGSDPFSAHATNDVVTLGTQTSPGLFTGGTLTVSSKSLANFDAVVGQVKGKFVLFGVTLDDTVTPIQPYVVLLVQQ